MLTWEPLGFGQNDDEVGYTDEGELGAFVMCRSQGWTVERYTSDVLAGPFPTKEAAKLAAEMMYG